MGVTEENSAKLKNLSEIQLIMGDPKLHSTLEPVVYSEASRCSLGVAASLGDCRGDGRGR